MMATDGYSPALHARESSGAALSESITQRVVTEYYSV